MCEQVEERLKFYETGVATRKNEEVMREAVEEYRICVAKQKKKNKKKKKKEVDTEEMGAEEIDKENGSVEPSVIVPVTKKQGKKKRSQVESSEVNLPETPKRRKQLRTT